MSILDVSAADIKFTTRPLGFDKAEVRAFIANILRDSAELVRYVERLEQDARALQDGETPLHAITGPVAVPAFETRPEAPPPPSQTPREVERILAAAERIATEVRESAGQDAWTIVNDAKAEAAALVREAESRASEIVGDAMRQVNALDDRTAGIRAHYLHLQAVFEAASATASIALKELAEGAEHADSHSHLDALDSEETPSVRRAG